MSVNVWFGLSVTGKLAPERVKPERESDADCTVTAFVPVEVSVTVFVDAVLSVTFPKARLVGLTVRAAVDATPVPLRLTVDVAAAVAVLARFRSPDTAPAAVGLN